MKSKFSKKIVVLVIILNVLFSAAVLYAFIKTGNEPVALIGAWFAFTVGELWTLARIKKEKIKNGGKHEDFSEKTDEP